MRRRRFLASIPLATGLAGCSLDSDRGTTSNDSRASIADDSSTPSAARAPGGTSTTHPEQTPASDPATCSPGSTKDAPQASAVIRSTYRHRKFADAFRVIRPAHNQFAFVRPPGDARGLPPDAFELAIGDRRYDPETSMPGPPWMPTVYDLYTAEAPSGFLPFDVQAHDAENAALVSDGTSYPIPDDALSSISTIPDFVVRNVSVPESVSVEGSVRLSVDVRNGGQREGIFLAGFQYSGLPSLITIRVEPGATETGTASYEVSRSGTMTFAFRYAGGSEQHEVLVTGTETPHSTGSDRDRS